jgi:hypothetical protein
MAILIAEHDLCRSHLHGAAAVLAEGASGRAAAATLDQAWLLLEFLETELETHISKEEGPLFPRLEASLPADDQLIDKMVAEHDLIRIKRDEIRTTLAGLATFCGHRTVWRLQSPTLVFDAAGLGLFAVAGGLKALAFHLNLLAAVLLGVVTGIG